MGKVVTLVGLDFGTTTSCAAVASAAIERNARTGRMEVSDCELLASPEPVFTPYLHGKLDEEAIDNYLAIWLGKIDLQNIFGGGALVTGLAAERANADVVARQVRRYLRDAVIAVGSDPRLESWLAYMSNCGPLTRQWPNVTFVNLDIGGGTTNVAAGRGADVLGTGCYFVGARHVELVPGGYRIKRLSKYARALFEQLQITKCEGDTLAEHEVLALVDWYVDLLEAIAVGVAGMRRDPATTLHEQVEFTLPCEAQDVAITLSGGVGQLVYRHLQGDEWPSTTEFGDLGIDLARRLASHPFWQKHLAAHVPAAFGRATVFGLLRHNTQVSGATIYIDDAITLPLISLVIVGSIDSATSDTDIAQLVDIAARTASGGCIRIQWKEGDGVTSVRELARRVGQTLAARQNTEGVPLVFLMRENLGKVFGQYLTNWGREKQNIVVIDEIDFRDAQFAHIGRLSGPVMPVSLYGMN